MKTRCALFVLAVSTLAFSQAGVIAETPVNDVMKHSVAATSHSNGAAATVSFDTAPVVAVNSRSTVVQLDQATVFIDPVGEQGDYVRFGRPDIVVLTRAAPSHLSTDTMIGMLRRDTVVLAPQVVIDQLPLMIANNVITPFDVGATQQVDGILFRALERSASKPDDVYIHRRERGDIGVLMDVDGDKIYF